MHLPNHPDTLFAFVKALKESGYRWVLLQEDSVENLDGSKLKHNQKYIPNQLVARSSSGETARITALIKTQGSDTKLVGQMQPYYESLGLNRQSLGGYTIPSIVSQIADGENGGVMMNEFPEAYIQANKTIRLKDNGVIAVNGSEYIELIEAYGVRSSSYPEIQAIKQSKLWNEVIEPINTKKVNAAINFLKSKDSNFKMSGASWTNNLSWEEGYQNVIEPINALSLRFHQKFDKKKKIDPSITNENNYKESLLYLLLLETSCFRYWGQGTWTDYAEEIYKRGNNIINNS